MISIRYEDIHPLFLERYKSDFKDWLKSDSPIQIYRIMLPSNYRVPLRGGKGSIEIGPIVCLRCSKVRVDAKTSYLKVTPRDQTDIDKIEEWACEERKRLDLKQKMKAAEQALPSADMTGPVDRVKDDSGDSVLIG